MEGLKSQMPTQNPLHAVGQMVDSALHGDTRVTHFASANEGPADIIAKVSGQKSTGKRLDDAPYFTNQDGIPWPDPAHSKTAGGIPVISDTFLLQKQQTFNRSKVLERMVHPAGAGAFGHFEVTKDVSGLTKANLFSSVGRKTPLFIRFSTVTVGREFPDTARNPRGFAIKFYTGEGNYDIVGLNWPIFFCRDPIQGPDVIRSQGRNPYNFFWPDHDTTFDLLANTPEGNHAGMMFFSDHGTPDGFTQEHGYGCHTFKWVNAEGKFVYIKYTFLAKHGQKQLTRQEANRLGGEDPDYSKRELYEKIEAKEYPEWTAYVQTMQPEEADPAKLGFDPFDVTKVWPRKQFPLQEFGKIVLNKNPENYHRDVEQAAFSPGAMVPGIEDSPDTLLQFRMFFYRDAQYHRIGVNLHQVPVNCPFMSSSYSPLNFDGQVRTDANHGGNADVNPNSDVMFSKFRPDTAEAPYAVSDNIVSRKSHYYHEGKLSEYDQARELYTRVMDDKARAALHANTAHWLAKVSKKVIKVKYLAQQYLIAPEYARSIYDLLPAPDFAFEEVVETSKGAESMGKHPKFMPNSGARSVGYPAPQGMGYN